MPRNIGYLTSKSTPESDEVYTPPYAVYAIAKYIPHIIDSDCHIANILCPFDKDEHAFPTVLKKLGYNVINTHYDPATGIGRDFFTYTKSECKKLQIDYIVSNPPFSKKNEVLKHCEELDVAYALLLPIQTLQSIDRYKNIFSNGQTQALIFDRRIGYSTKDKSWEEIGMTNHFASIFICKWVLPSSLMFDNLISNSN
jgi:hypothetical protein